MRAARNIFIYTIKITSEITIKITKKYEKVHKLSVRLPKIISAVPFVAYV
jgi:hypothetical protein